MKPKKYFKVSNELEIESSKSFKLENIKTSKTINISNLLYRNLFKNKINRTMAIG